LLRQAAQELFVWFVGFAETLVRPSPSASDEGTLAGARARTDGGFVRESVQRLLASRTTFDVLGRSVGSVSVKQSLKLVRR
jgi:hypothetical protein